VMVTAASTDEGTVAVRIPDGPRRSSALVAPHRLPPGHRPRRCRPSPWPDALRLRRGAEVATMVLGVVSAGAVRRSRDRDTEPVGSGLRRRRVADLYGIGRIRAPLRPGAGK
jgi:hypothetical protein